MVGSRGSFPPSIYKDWGATMCMGLVYFHASEQTLAFVQDAYRVVLILGDDQVGFNKALKDADIQWLVRHDSTGDEDNLIFVSENDKLDYMNSSSVSMGQAWLSSTLRLRVALLPHHKFPRRCDNGVNTGKAVVSHCYSEKKGIAKEETIKSQGGWHLALDWEQASQKRTAELRKTPEKSRVASRAPFRAWILELMPTRPDMNGRRAPVQAAAFHSL